MYHNVFKYEYLTFQTQIHLHEQYIFVIDTNNIQSEYAFLFPFSIYNSDSIRNYQDYIRFKIKTNIEKFIQFYWKYKERNVSQYIAII